MILKQSTSARISKAEMQVLEATWMVKSPSRDVDGELEQTKLRNSENSDMNVAEALGGAVIEENLEL